MDLKSLPTRAHGVLAIGFLMVATGCTTVEPSGAQPAGMQPAVKTDHIQLLAANVGSGLCVLVTCPNGNLVLNDCGTLGGMDSPEVQSAKQLIKGKIDGMDDDEKLYVITSHPDKDHVNLIPEVVSDTAIQRNLAGFYQNVAVREYEKKLGVWLAKVPTSKRHVLPESEKTRPPMLLADIPCVGAGGIYLLANDVGSKPNDKSAVLLYDSGQGAMAITTGDAEDETLDFLIDYRAKFVTHALLIVPHHGSSNKTNGKDWAEASKPEIVFFSAGDNSRYGHPRCDVVKRYHEFAVQLAGTHAIQCYEGRALQPPTQIDRAEFNTRNSGALLFVPGRESRYVDTCPNNIVTRANCTRVDIPIPPGFLLSQRL